MPNWCRNTLAITGPKDILTDFRRKARNIYIGYQGNEKGFFCINNFIPMPEELKGTRVSFEDINSQLEMSESLNWYVWRLKNWGTKWEVDSDSDCEETDNKLIYKFESAWAAPGMAILKISSAYPDLVYELKYEEFGMAFYGKTKFMAGKVISFEHHKIEYHGFCLVCGVTNYFLTWDADCPKCGRLMQKIKLSDIGITII